MLNWEPLQHYSSLTGVDAKLTFGKENRSGIYIWGFKDDNDLFWPYYVGKHRNVPFRLCEHLSNLKGGTYTIYSEEELFSWSRNSIYCPINLQTRIAFILELDEEVKKSMLNMINRFHFTFALINDYNAKGDDCERNVIEAIDSELLANKRRGKVVNAVDVGNLFDIIGDHCQNSFVSLSEAPLTSFPAKRV